MVIARKACRLVWIKKIVFDSLINTKNGLLEVRRGPFLINDSEIEISFQVDNKDTIFTYTLQKQNYWSVGYSETRHEFQFMVSDSVDFFNSRID
jgi:hypothetical protein